MPKRITKGARKLLIIEDDEVMLELVEQTLEGRGYEVLCTTNTLGASLSIKREKPEVLILDVLLPGSISGEAFCRKVRSEHPYLKIVLFSGIEQEDMKNLLANKLADACVPKAEGVDRLCEVVESLLKASVPR